MRAKKGVSSYDLPIFYKMGRNVTATPPFLCLRAFGECPQIIFHNKLAYMRKYYITNIKYYYL